MFITTSSDTKEARKYADKQQQKSLKLIDGDLLAELMIKYGIGLEKVQTYIVYKINEDFFEWILKDWFFAQQSQNVDLESRYNKSGWDELCE